MWQYIKQKSQDAEHHFLAFGLLALFGHPLFYFLNYVSPNPVYENLPLRIFAILLSIPLILHKSWPAKLENLKPFYWYFSVTYILPFFFAFMLLKNPFYIEWQLNFLITITLLILLFDWISVTMIAITGIACASLFYYLTDSVPILPTNFTALINTIISLLVYCALFSHKKEAIQTERKIRLELTKEENIRLEKKVQERTSELEIALSAKTDFLNKMSHEIRTPIQGVTAISEGLIQCWKNLMTIRNSNLLAKLQAMLNAF